MSKTDLIIPKLKDKFVDLRGRLPGDSYSWSRERPIPKISYLAIHHSGGPWDQTALEIANFHINSNKWGGIGYHFLIDKAGLVYYVGDISTARANVANLNEQVIGICLIGNFTKVLPSLEQVDSARILCEYFIKSYPGLLIAGHSELPSQSTTCPGETWFLWKSKIISEVEFLKSQNKSLQSSLAIVNQQMISLQQKIYGGGLIQSEKDHRITRALLNLYRFIFVGSKRKK
jgi:hypothetical protein